MWWSSSAWPDQSLKLCKAFWLQRICPLWAWHNIILQKTKKSMHRHIAQQSHILIGMHDLLLALNTLYMFSVQGIGAEGCKELLEAFEACVKGATAASWGGHDFTCKYFYFLILLCFSLTFILFEIYLQLFIFINLSRVFHYNIIVKW